MRDVVMSDSIFNATVADSGEGPQMEPQIGSPGLEADKHSAARAQAEGHHPEITDLVRIILVGAGALASWLRLWEPLPQVDIIGLLTAFVGGYSIFRKAVEDIRSRRITMELSMSIALGAAMAIREFFTASLIVFFVLIAEVLEQLAVGRGRKAIQELIDFLTAGLKFDVKAGSRRSASARFEPATLCWSGPAHGFPWTVRW